MLTKLDLKNRRIIHQLDLNSRQSNSEIAKKVGLSKQVVGFRISRLLEEKIISSFYPVIDVSKLGFTVHKIFLRLQNLDRKKEKELVSYLVEHPNVVWVASCDGRFDLAFGTWARDITFLDKTIAGLNKNFGDNIIERQMAAIITGEYFPRDYLINKKEPSAYDQPYFAAAAEKVKIDKTDWKILFMFGKNSREPVVGISRKIRLSPDAVGDRLRRMERLGVIKHCNIVPNESVYPYLHYKILISFRNISEEREKLLREYCRVKPNIVFIVKAFGPWEFEIDLEVENPEKFREAIMDMKTEFSDILKEYLVMSIYQVHKYNYCPSIPED